MAKKRTSEKSAGSGMDTRRILGKILKSIRPYRLLVVLSLLLAVISVVLTLYIPILTGRGVDRIIDRGLVDFEGLLEIIRNILVCILLTAGSQWLMNHINNKITYHIVQDLRIRAFRHLQKLPLSYIDAHPAGDLISRVITDIEQFSDGLLMGFTQLFTGVVTIAGTILFMLSIHPLITLVVVVLSPLSFLIAGFISKRTFSMFRKQSETRGELTALTDEMLGNLKTVIAFDHQEEARKEFEEINGRLAGYSLKATFFSSLTNPATRFMYSAIYAGVTIAGCFTVIGGGLSVGQLSSFLSYTNQYTKPFNEITGVITEFQNSLASAGRVFELLDQEILPDDEAQASLGQVRGQVDLEHVFFSYTPDKKLIEDFNLHVKPGQRIAVVGPTGCGKTTLINLLMRFYDTDSGAIRVEGQDIRKVSRQSLRSNYGMVLQENLAEIRHNPGKYHLRLSRRRGRRHNPGR